MKVLFVVPRYHTNMIGWIKALKSIGCEVEVNAIIKGKTENYTELHPQIFELSSLSRLIMKLLGEGGTNQPRGFPRIFKYFSALKKSRPDIIVVRDITRWFSFMAAIYGRLLGIKVIIYSQLTMHTYYTEKRRKTINWANKFFNSFWMTPIRGEANIKEVLPEKLVYIPLVVDINKSQNQHLSNIPRLLTIGKFVERKKHLLLLAALKNLKARGFKFELTIVGEISSALHESNYAKVVSFIEENNMTGDVNIKVNVPHENIGEIFAASDLFILPATNEPAGVSVLEAMAYSLPVICSTTCGTQWYIKHGQTGYIFKDESINDLEESLIWFFDYTDKAQLYKNCLLNAEDEISGAKFLELFNKSLKAYFDISLN